MNSFEFWVRRLSIKKKLILSFSLMIALTFLLGASMMRSLYSLKSQAEEYERLKHSFILAGETRQAMENMRRSLDGYLLGVRSERQRCEMLFLETERNIESLKTTARTPVERENQRNLEIALRTVEALLQPVLSMVEEGRRNEAMFRMNDEVNPSLDGLGNRLEMLHNMMKSRTDVAWEEAKKLAQRTLFASLILFGSILLAGAGLALGLYRSIAHPLAILEDGTRRVAEGIWNVRMEALDPPEFRALAKSFEDMTHSLSALQVHVTQLDRMSAVGTLAGGVAHEINNPLTGVLGQSQFILEKLPPADPLRSNVEKIERAAQKCRKIVRSLLDFSRPSDYMFQAIDVSSVVTQALALCEAEMALKNITVRWQPSSLPKIWASENHLEQVFINILMNALHAMPEGGILAIRAQLVRPRGIYSGRPWSEGIDFGRDHVAVIFEDTGMGIEPKNISRIFDPFFTTKEPGKGTGLGLSICYNIMKVHQGDITAESEGPGKGTKFTVRVPVVREPETAPVTAPFGLLEKKLIELEERFES